MEKRAYQRDLKLDFFATQGWRGRQGRDLVECTGELRRCLCERRALKRQLAGFAPPLDGRFGEARLSEMMRQQFRFYRNLGGEFVAQGLGDAAVQDLAPASEQILIGRV